MKRASMTMLQSRILVAVLVFLSTIVLLLCLNPPMAQDVGGGGGDGDDGGDGEARRSWSKIMVWASLTFVLALALPSLMPSAKTMSNT